MKFELTDTEFDTLERAREQFGGANEYRMAIEELAETVVSIAHFRRGRVDIGEVVSEFADAFVCTMQLLLSELGNVEGCNELKKMIVEAAISNSFRKLHAKVENNDKNYAEGRSE